MQKGVSPDEYIDNQQKINETSYPEIEDFYSNLNMEDITDADYIHAKRVCKNFYRKKIQINTLTGMFKMIHYC